MSKTSVSNFFFAFLVNFQTTIWLLRCLSDVQNRCISCFKFVMTVYLKFKHIKAYANVGYLASFYCITILLILYIILKLLIRSLKLKSNCIGLNYTSFMAACHEQSRFIIQIKFIITLPVNGTMFVLRMKVCFMCMNYRDSCRENFQTMGIFILASLYIFLKILIKSL